MKLLNINLLLLFLLQNIFAQDYQIRVSVNKNKIALNERFEYKVEVSGQSTSLPDPKIGEFENFAILNGPNTSTNIQFVNGKMSSSKSHSYIIMPRNIGRFTLPIATFEIDGQTYQSNKVTIQVVKEKKKKTQQQKPVAAKADEDLLGENLYLKAHINKRNVFKNEQILVTYKLYFRLTVRSFNFDKIPANPGFWKEEFKLPGQPSISTEVINGIAYQVATLRKIALFPTQAGELTIEPLIISVDALVKRKSRSKSIFDSFFTDPFGRTVRKSLSSQTVKIKVKKLPKNGRPADFTGVVGKYSMSVNADKNIVQANDAVSVKVLISGEGNIKLIVPPKLITPPDLEKYDPKEKSSIKRKNNKVSGKKEVEYILVPRFEGDYTIKPVKFSYFDPNERNYKTLKSKPIELKVTTGNVSSIGIPTGGALSKQEVALLGKDIRFIKEVVAFNPAGEKLYTNYFYLMGYFIPILLMGFVFNYRRSQDKLLGDEQFARRKKAGKIAAKYLGQAKKTVSVESGKGFYNIMSKALQGFVSDKLNIDMTDFTAITVNTNLAKRGVAEEEIREYQNCIDESDFKQFSGGNIDTNEMLTFFEKAKICLTKLEKYI